MKKIILLILLLSVTATYAKDFHKTEDMIDTILKEESESSSVKKENPPAGENISGENSSAEKEKAAGEEKDETQPADNEEQPVKNTAMSGNDEILLKTGIQLYESGMYDHALVRFNDIIKNFPTSKFIDSARMWSGRIYIRKYDYDNAIKEFDSIGEKSGEYPAALFYKGESLRIKGDKVAAIENYQKISSTWPDNELADNSILLTGKLYLSSGKGYQSLESALRIIRSYKDTESVDDAYYLIAKIYEKDPVLKDIEMSRKFYRAFLKKADSGQKHFADSPLKEVVKKDLEYLDKTYFRLDR